MSPYDQPMQGAAPPKQLLPGPMTPADVASANGANLQSYWQEAGPKFSDPQWWQQTLTDAAHQWAQAMLAGSVAPGRGIRAFHGSPYDFDRFDLSKIGTGEGAQAYGHGLYFAGNEGVARSYRDIPPNGLPTADNIARRLLPVFDADRTFRSIKAVAPEISDEEINAAIQRAQSVPPGRMYEVEIAATPDQLLDWNKPLSQQPQGIQDALRRYGSYYDRIIRENNWTGGDVAARIEGPVQREEMVQAGIPGIQYLDAGSRGAGEGSRNYVVFDDNLINILRKYMMPGMLGGGAAAAGAGVNPYAQ